MKVNCKGILFLISVLLALCSIWMLSENLQKTIHFHIYNSTESENSSEILRTIYPTAKGTLEEYVANKLLKPPSEKPYNLDNSTQDYRALVHAASWKFINKNVKRLFSNQTSGFFIEAGALDGEALSNTLWLEKEKGWTGLLVEPNPTSYLALTKKNRKAWSINCCLATSPYPQIANFQSIRPANNKADGTGNYWFFQARSKILDEKTILDQVAASPFYQSDYSKALCLPIGYLLKTLNVSTVDFFSLDIEVGELRVLETFPFDSVKLKVLVVESISKERSKHKQALIDFMKSKGYVLVDVSEDEDYIFVLKGAVSLQKIFNLLK